MRKSRMRLGAIAFGVLFGTVFGAYVLWRAGGWVLDRLVYENPTFAIRLVEVQSNGVISPEQLRGWAMVKPGDNLLALDLARVKRNLERVPMIASVSLERILPRTLRIRVTEREPVAQVVLSRAVPGGAPASVVYHLDTDGYVMLPLDPRQRSAPLVQTDDALPRLQGVNPAEVLPGRRLSSPQLTAALKLITKHSVSPMAGLADLREIDVSSPVVLVVKTGQGSEITFGLEDLDHQLLRWRKIYDLGQSTKRNVASIDLAISNNVPVRWLEANVTPPPAKAPKSTRPRKRNV